MKKDVGIYVLKAIGYAFLAGVSTVGLLTGMYGSMGNGAAAAASIGKLHSVNSDATEKESEESDQ